jgi:hypothetical protein
MKGEAFSPSLFVHSYGIFSELYTRIVGSSAFPSALSMLFFKCKIFFGGGVESWYESHRKALMPVGAPYEVVRNILATNLNSLPPRTWRVAGGSKAMGECLVPQNGTIL